MLATRHVQMVQQRVQPEENRCPLCGESPDTNTHMMSGCEFPACERVRDMWQQKAADLLKEHSASEEAAASLPDRL